MRKKPDPGIISQLTAFTIIGHKNHIIYLFQALNLKPIRIVITDF